MKNISSSPSNSEPFIAILTTQAVISSSLFVANPASHADPEKHHAMKQLLTLLLGALEARTKVLVKLNVETSVALDKVISLLPSMKAPTVNELHGGRGYAVETVVAKDNINILIPDLRAAGATDIVEQAIAKIIH